MKNTNSYIGKGVFEIKQRDLEAVDPVNGFAEGEVEERKRKIVPGKPKIGMGLSVVGFDEG